MSDIGQNNRFAILFLGSIIFGLGLFFWLVQKMPPVPKAPPPVILDSVSFQIMADKAAAIADDKTHYSVQHGIVEINIHNVTRPAYKPLESLAKGLDRYPKASRFCMSYGCFWGRHGSNTRVLYDRRTHRLVCRCFGENNPWGGFSGYMVFTKVTDLALQQDARDLKRSPRALPCDEDVDVVFNDLPRYGCSLKLTTNWIQTP